jgi:hypothetical protein
MVGAILAAGAVMRQPADAPPPAVELTPEQKAHNAKVYAQHKAAEELAERRFLEAARVARALKASMKNPRSFELVETLRMDSGALCFTYRATNSFNAVVPGHAVYHGGSIVASGHDGFTARWNRHCGGKTGTAVRGLAYAL